MKRLRISLKRREAITVDRVIAGKLKLAYVICADKKLRYGKKRSKIAYIGTTKNGIDRFAQSAASRSEEVFALHGVERFTVHVVTCTPRQKVKTWHKLERALIIAFKVAFGEVPKCNVQGKHKNYTWTGENKMFSIARLLTVIEDLS
jgi:NAD-dependent SIR2 family protein deacetylase